VLALELVDERVQAVGLKEPPLPPSLHETEPAGVDEVPWAVSETVAVSLRLPPATTEAGEGATPVLVERWLTVT